MIYLTTSLLLVLVLVLLKAAHLYAAYRRRRALADACFAAFADAIRVDLGGLPKLSDVPPVPARVSASTVAALADAFNEYADACLSLKNLVESGRLDSLAGGMAQVRLDRAISVALLSCSESELLRLEQVLGGG